MQDQLALPTGNSCQVTLRPAVRRRCRLCHRDLRIKEMKMFVPRSCWQQNLTSRSGWVRIIHKVQTFAVTVRKTAGPEPSPVHIHHYSSHLARAESTLWKWHSPYRQPQSQRLHCYLRPTPSMGALTVLVNCRVTESLHEGLLRTSVCEKSSCFAGRKLNPRTTAWSCRCMRGLRWQQ